jgi:serine/threonine protein kinase
MGSIPTKSSLTYRNQFIFSYVIGKGGFGKVSSAMHIESKEWCAMKEINLNQLIKHKNGMEMLMTELSAHKQVGSHQFIVNMKSAFHDYEICYMSFDLCVGGDLRYHLRRGHQFNEEATAFIVACIGSALHHIHSKGIIHRDVKPENILLDDYGFALLADFGVAHAKPTVQHTITSLEDDDFCYLRSGTKQYLAPEVFTKSHKHNYSADFWSLGVVAYELIHGIRPFEKHCPIPFVQYLEQKASLFAFTPSLPSAGSQHLPNLLQRDQEVHLPCCFHKSSSTCNCRSLSECCVTIREGVPCVYLPEISRINGILTQSCQRVLTGLLSVDPNSRTGHGDVNYFNLVNDSWFEENQMNWNEILEGDIVPPFTPDLREVSLDICKRYRDESSQGAPQCRCYDNSCLSCRPLPIPTEVRNVLNDFHYVTPEYEKYAFVYSDLVAQTQLTPLLTALPTPSKNMATTRIQIRRSNSSQVHVST